VRVLSNADLDREEEKKETDKRQQAPEIQGIVAYVNNAWEEAKAERLVVEDRMAASLRQRRGEYDAGKLAAIREMGGSEIYMMLTSVKCRAAASWIRDTLLGTGAEKPWTIRPTPVPDLPQQAIQEIGQRVQQEIDKFLQSGGLQPTEDMIYTANQIAIDRLMAMRVDAANKSAKIVETKMDDQLKEGGLEKALHQFIDDLVTFPSAFIKGPVIRKKPQMTWGPNNEPIVKDEIVKEWERVSPLYIYPSPQSEGIHDGYLIERHILSRTQINDLRGVEGYDEGALKSVLEEYQRGGLNEWLNIDTMSDSREETRLRGGSGLQPAAATIDALQFWGDIPGQMLIDWGMDKKRVDDPLKDYTAEVWLIGRWAIKVMLNPDPLRRRPYYKASYEEIPGQFWGHGVTDLVRDCQDVCNAAARSLVNNMGFASGPQMWVNVDQLADGEEVTVLIPWKIHQGKSDPMGGNQPPVGFFQPQSLSRELMEVYQKYSDLADEYSGVPKYMQGGAAAGGAGRTASGLSMMMSNAGKAIKQVLANIDVSILQPLLEYLFYYNMRYSPDEALKNGDIKIVARGASGLVAKESHQVRLNEFLNMSINNQTVSQIIGPEGIAALLREGADGLGMDTDKIIPSEEMIKANAMAAEQVQKAEKMEQDEMLAQARQQPIEQISFQRDGNGEMQGMEIKAPQGPQGQNLMDGAPVTSNMVPSSR
jgi:hypothetical protein